ncbi:pyruvate formate-lyase-activating protein [Kribbella sindirgiensis]|uniref:Pyruvate formate-lyase-activating enzyme n=1 Tax=Kribbella sindirgiensis TaxID=1124744 RepID=A0A4V2M1Z0_9ACTN|nr:pyruvate formate-lyase-activating protein [Kribbella sindirgiensis]TCC20567.1 pyruvate formate lyase-activating protein [Kribbella sindirgiensis]
MGLDVAPATATAGATCSGAVHSWDLSTGVDGPGTRLVLFLAGCPLRCLYCQNPDTWSERDGARTTVPEVMQKVQRYRRILDRTGGGLTVSGGEPLLQPKFTAAVFKACQEDGVSTVLDTSGALGARATDDLLLDTDLVLLDIKSFVPATYAQVTGGGDVAPTLRFARRLAGLERRIWIRFVLVPGLNDAPGNLAPLADFVAGLGTVERVDVLPFHTLAIPKYQELGLTFPLTGHPTPTPEQTAAARHHFATRGLTVT